MHRHLNDTTVDRYLARTLDRADLHALDEHVAGCLRCTLAVEAVAVDPARWERRGPLGRLVRVTPGRRALRDADRVERVA